MKKKDSFTNHLSIRAGDSRLRDYKCRKIQPTGRKSLSKKDLKLVKEFQEFLNSLVAEDAKILVNEKISLKKEMEFLVRFCSRNRAS